MSKMTLRRTLRREESADLLANTFYPPDNPDTDEECHRIVRESVRKRIADLDIVPNTAPEYVPIELEEILRVLKGMSSSKAPGDDGFTADICLRSFQTAPTIFQAILNRCLYLGCFPRVWKRARIVIIRKPGKTDYTSPKSYRPIGLLPINGKVLERIICSRIL